MRRAVSTILVAALVVLAGCGGATGPGTDATGTTAADATSEGTTEVATASDDSGAGGTVNLYVSDERNAIDAFAHVNVTVSKVGFQRGGENGSWVERDVGDATVDLTRLKGANATVLDRFDVPNGTYTKVFVHVSEINGTLTDGERVNVKLPSEKLHVNQQFTVGNGEDVDFVFDITVVEAGKSGKFVVKPVVSESGTEVPIDRVDVGDDEDDRDGDAQLNATFVGNVSAGGDATVSVTQNGSAVENATVAVAGEVVAHTGANGTATVPVPADAEELEVTVRAGDREVELSRDALTEAATDAAPLSAAFVGDVTAGSDATVEVTRDGDPVADASVAVGGEVVATTDEDGRAEISVPASGSLNVTVRADGDAVTLEPDVTDL